MGRACAGTRAAVLLLLSLGRNGAPFLPYFLLMLAGEWRGRRSKKKRIDALREHTYTHTHAHTHTQNDLLQFVVQVKMSKSICLQRVLFTTISRQITLLFLKANES